MSHGQQSEWDGPLPLPGLLGGAKQLVSTRLRQLLDEYGYPGVRGGHECVFRFLDTQGCRLTDLAARAGLSKQAVGEVVAEVERLGYVERTPAPEDGRVKIIRLTPRGKEAQDAAGRILDDIEREWAERFGADRIAAFRETLQDIAAAPVAPPSDE